MKRSLALMAITFLCSIGVAVAQQAPPSVLTPKELKRLIPELRQEPRALSNGTVAASKRLAPASRVVSTNGRDISNSTAFVYHATICIFFTPDLYQNQLILAYDPSQGLAFYSLNDLYLGQTLLTGCVHGNFEEAILDNGGNLVEVLTFPNG